MLSDAEAFADAASLTNSKFSKMSLLLLSVPENKAPATTIVATKTTESAAVSILFILTDLSIFTS
jgi:hypothetical protein